MEIFQGGWQMGEKNLGGDFVKKKQINPLRVGWVSEITKHDACITCCSSFRSVCQVCFQGGWQMGEKNLGGDLLKIIEITPPPPCRMGVGNHNTNQTH